MNFINEVRAIGSAQRLIGIIAVLLVILSQPGVAVEIAPRILDGSNTYQSSFPAVVKLNINNFSGPYLGSGTLISPNHVLTAGHMVTDEFGNFNVYNTSTVDIDGYLYSISRMYKHPTWNGQVGTGVLDVAIIELSDSVPEISPIPVYRYTPTIGQVTQLVGYGLQGTGAFGTNGIFPTDGTVNYGNAPIDSVLPGYIVRYFQPGESTTAPGDSGGPALLYFNDVARVAGITSFGPLNDVWYTDTYSTRVDAVCDFIDAVCGFTNLTAGMYTAPTTVKIGQTISISSKVINQGYLSAPAFTVQYRLSQDTIFDHGTIDLASFTFANGLLARYQNDASVNVIINGVVAPGSYYLTWKIDSGNAVYESDKTDNTFFAPTPMVVYANHVPSVISVANATPFSPVINETVTFSVGASDQDGDVVSYTWDFGDGASGNGSFPNHKYVAPGTYTATVTMSDGISSVNSSVQVIVKPFITSATATPNPVIAGGKVILAATAKDSAGYTNYVWSLNGNPIQLYYDRSAPNTFFFWPNTVGNQVLTLDAKSTLNHETKMITLTVNPGFSGVASGSTTNVQCYKHKFGVDFRKQSKDSLDITLTDMNHFLWTDKTLFGNAVKNKVVSIFIGDSLIDSVTMLSTGKSYLGTGTCTWTYKAGTIRYSLKSTNLQDVLNPFAVLNQTIKDGTVTVPVTLLIDGVKFTTNAQFIYTGKAGVSGAGK